MVPEGFQLLPRLQRSLQDVLPSLAVRKLPLLHDILTRAAEATVADYLVYTNADIILHWDFYRRVAEMLRGGCASLTITRRTVAGSLSNPGDLAAIEAEPGAPHPGFDCFVFPRTVVGATDLGRLCIGLQGWEGPLLGNLLTHGPLFVIMRQEYLTFHLGRDQRWNKQDRLSRRTNDVNCSEGYRVLGRLRAQARDPALRTYLREESAGCGSRLSYAAGCGGGYEGASAGYRQNGRSADTHPRWRSHCAPLV